MLIRCFIIDDTLANWHCTLQIWNFPGVSNHHQMLLDQPGCVKAQKMKRKCILGYFDLGMPLFFWGVGGHN